MASTFEVLAEPRRREILDLLRNGERPVGELVERLRLAQPTVSKHLKVLHGAGLVEVRRDGQRRWYRLRLEPLAEIDAWLEPYRRMWTTSPDALETTPGHDGGARMSECAGSSMPLAERPGRGPRQAPRQRAVTVHEDHMRR